MCFWKWGHDWQDASEAKKKRITKALKLFGIYPSKIELCSKCERIRLTATTILNNKPKQSIMPPWNFQQKETLS